MQVFFLRLAVLNLCRPVERSASMKDGKPEWGEKHKAHHSYFVQAGGVKRKRGGRQVNQKKPPGVLVPLMKLPC